MKNITVLIIIIVIQITGLYSQDIPFETVKLDLNKALTIGIENNYDLKYNRIEQLITKKIVKETWRQFLPVFSIDYGNSYNIAHHQQDTRMHSLKFKVSQPLYQGGRYHAAYKISELDHKVKRITFNILLNNIKASIQKQYFSVIIQKEIKKIQEKLIEQASIQERLAKEENRLGLLTTIDLAEIEAYAQNAELEDIKARNKLAEELNNLKKILYLQWRQQIAIDDKVINNFEYNRVKLKLDQLISFAYQRRRDLLNMYSQLIQKYYNYKSNKYYYLPSVSLNFDYTLSGEKFYPFNRSWNVGLQFDFLFKGTSVSQSGNYGEEINNNQKTYSSQSSVTPFADIGYVSRYIQAEATLRTVKVKLEQLKQDIGIETENNLNMVKEYWDLLMILKKREGVLRKRHTVYQLKIKLGEAKRVDVVEAEIEYYKAQAETMKGILNYINAVLDLELAIGAEIGHLNAIKIKGF